MDDKKLVSPFPSILKGVERFLELASPETREPLFVHVAAGLSSFRWDRGPNSCDARGATMTAAGAMDALRSFADKRWASCDVRWAPRFGPADRWSMAPFDVYPGLPPPPRQVPNFLALGQAPQNPDPRTVWAIVYVAVPFSEVDPEFREWLDRANACLPFKLQASGWRRVEPGGKGQPVYRKLKLVG